MTINEYLRYLRIEKGIKLREFSKVINYSHGHISRIENGKTSFDKVFLSKFIKAVSNNEEEHNLIKKIIKNDYNIDVEGSNDVNYTHKKKRPISLNNFVDQQYEIDGIKLSNEEMRFAISMTRCYRSFKKGDE
ncbi:helix-turn-helix transcriptional regulator [Staphylococcus coagulans]|uniref:helix-turn-helix domain-containing protein n=1 Tax=Staphylococcus coagulans TaxID=74706 RepID=UPI001BE95395|nr:helix-turn-helix transcriptional regulator [Staphylococcus coagulans]MBT2860983.1 helix-turn-helix transcriptional regulator [Staphylococcus coagulans]